MASNNRPIHEIKLARIRATLWLNRDGSKTWYSVAIARTYRDGDEWKDTTSFSRDDLPLVAKAAEMAYSWIWQIDAGRKEKQHAGS